MILLLISRLGLTAPIRAALYSAELRDAAEATSADGISAGHVRGVSLGKLVNLAATVRPRENDVYRVVSAAGSRILRPRH